MSSSQVDVLIVGAGPGKFTMRMGLVALADDDMRI